MIRTRLCTLLEIEHPIVLGGMASGATGPALVAAVSNAGGLGTLGISGLSAETIREHMAAIRSATEKPYAVNFLLFLTQSGPFEAAVAERPAVMAFAWARQDQELRTFFDPVHEAGTKVMYMASDVPEARRAAAAGADVIVAQDASSALHTLLEYKLIRLLGRDKGPGRALLYGTTRQFLSLFGLKDLDDLPTLEEFDLKPVELPTDVREAG